MYTESMIACILESGKKVFLRHVVVDVLVVDRDKILLVKRAPELPNGGKYGVIGGYVERDETLEQAARREVLEETGYKVKINSLLRVKDSPHRPQEEVQNIAFVFIASPIKKTQEGDNESTEVKWFDFDNLPSQDEFAFDHYEDIQAYLRHGKSPQPMPLL